ncbi:MAG: hypothetical protein ACI8R4_002010 [Paracoccaceae bacterium]|jgi:hypothetical protein
MESGLVEFSCAMSPTGPCYSEAEINAVDISFAPFAAGIALLLPHYRDYALPTSNDHWPRYAIWWQAIEASGLQTPTQGDAQSYDRRLIEFYQPYSQGGRQRDVTLIA